MSHILDHVNFESIQPYIHKGYDSNNFSNLVFVFDNMMLSNLAFSARTNPQEFNLLLDAMSLKEGIILIPEIIMDESAGNRDMTPERYREYYEPLFKALSQYTDIFVVPFETCFEIIKEGAVDSNEAFAQFQLIAKQWNKTNMEIQLKIEASTDVEGIKSALISVDRLH